MLSYDERALLCRSLREDAHRLPHNLIVNRLAASALVPRAGRLWLYRRSGMDVQTGNIFEGCTIAGTNLSIGAATFINRRCFLEAVGPLRIGSRCQIAMEVMLLTTTHPLGRDGSVLPRSFALPTTVGDGCWLGARALVLPGVTIGAGCVIAAGAVVADDCDPGGLYGGIPARRIRSLVSSTREPAWPLST